MTAHSLTDAIRADAAERHARGEGADRIIVMEQGQIVEDGTHADLMALGGRYAKAYAQWERG